MVAPPPELVRAVAAFLPARDLRPWSGAARAERAALRARLASSHIWHAWLRARRRAWCLASAGFYRALAPAGEAAFTNFPAAGLPSREHPAFTRLRREGPLSLGCRSFRCPACGLRPIAAAAHLPAACFPESAPAEPPYLFFSCHPCLAAALHRLAARGRRTRRPVAVALLALASRRPGGSTWQIAGWARPGAGGRLRPASGPPGSPSDESSGEERPRPRSPPFS